MENASESTLVEGVPPGDIAMDNLYPALFQCFAIIMCGYVAGRQNLISQTEVKGLNTFVGTFSLPALIFLSLAELDLDSVNWMFLLAILVAKGIVFGFVIVITLLINRPMNLGRAGLFAIFCTQSNDFAIGYPIDSKDRLAYCFLLHSSLVLHNFLLMAGNGLVPDVLDVSVLARSPTPNSSVDGMHWSTYTRESRTYLNIDSSLEMKQGFEQEFAITELERRRRSSSASVHSPWHIVLLLLVALYIQRS